MTFYDMVRLARQQALLEKTKVSSADMSMSSLDNESPVPVQNEKELVQLSHDVPSLPMASEHLITSLIRLRRSWI